MASLDLHPGFMDTNTRLKLNGLTLAQKDVRKYPLSFFMNPKAPFLSLSEPMSLRCLPSPSGPYWARRLVQLYSPHFIYIYDKLNWYALSNYSLSLISNVHPL